MTESQDILVIGEVHDGQLSLTTAEIVAAARELAQRSGADVAVGLASANLAEAAQEAIHAGADRVYTIVDSLLDTPQVDLQLAALAALCRSVEPGTILLGRTDLGRELAPRLAGRLGVSLMQDCQRVDIDHNNGQLVGTRPVYGGSVLARVRSTATPQIAAIRPRMYAPLELDTTRQGDITAIPVSLDASMAKVTVVRQEIDESPGVKLEDARIVVAGGRGLGGPEPFAELQELAGILGAGIGASRAAVDAGWVPGNWQIGLTGRTITPDLYITFGISGASQHMAGCANSKMIIAINTDAEANIFREARYGVVGEWATILPAFMDAVRALQ